MSEAIPKRQPRQRPDGRRQLLVYVSPDVIKEVKKAAVDDDTTASAIVEAALKDWLTKHGITGTEDRGKD
jgi:hypothetical protein